MRKGLCGVVPFVCNFSIIWTEIRPTNGVSIICDVDDIICVRILNSPLSSVRESMSRVHLCIKQELYHLFDAVHLSITHHVSKLSGWS